MNVFAAALTIFWQTLGSAAFNLLVTTAQKSGAINKLDAFGIRFGHTATSAILALKTNSKPPDFPNSSASSTEKR